METEGWKVSLEMQLKRVCLEVRSSSKRMDQQRLWGGTSEREKENTRTGPNYSSHQVRTAGHNTELLTNNID